MSIGAMGRILIRYKATGYVGSGVVVLEAAIRHHEERLERRHRGVTALNNTADKWLEGLNGDTRAKVSPLSSPFNRLGSAHQSTFTRSYLGHFSSF